MSRKVDRLEIRAFLEEKVRLYNRPDFIENDPISIPYLFSRKEDVEIAGFLVATIAWGRRDLILKSAHQLMKLLEYSPYDFVTTASTNELKHLQGFYYRTFNSLDCQYFIQALKNIYLLHGGLEEVFTEGYNRGGLEGALTYFREVFLNFNPPARSLKHVANILKGASAKRLNMFLRWMVRKDNCGVDFGLWHAISVKDLLIPLDLHTGNVARKLGLLSRKQNDFKAVMELTNCLRGFDESDPVKYDFALFGLGLNEGF